MKILFTNKIELMSVIVGTLAVGYGLGIGQYTSDLRFLSVAIAYLIGLTAHLVWKNKHENHIS